MRPVSGFPLWIGHVGDVRDPRALFSTGILAVIDLALNEPPAALPRELVYCRFPLIDGVGNPPWLLRAAVDCVANFLRSDTRTLVYCGAGMSRSPCIAAAAIARLRGCSVVGEQHCLHRNPLCHKECRTMPKSDEKRQVYDGKHVMASVATLLTHYRLFSRRSFDMGGEVRGCGHRSRIMD